MKNKKLLFLVLIYFLYSQLYSSRPQIDNKFTNLESLQQILIFKKNISPENLSNKDQITWGHFIQLQGRLFDLWSYQNGANIHLNNTISHCLLLFDKGKSITSTDDPEIYKILQETVQLSEKLIVKLSNNSK